MPPQGERLTASQVNDLIAWVKMGAPDPRQARPATGNGAGDKGGEGRNHWAFKPVRQPLMPEVQNRSWVKNEVDGFILAKLEGNGLGPSAPADKHTLIRRVYYDLIGLPPTPEQVKAFVEDPSAVAWEKVVDELLRSQVRRALGAALAGCGSLFRYQRSSQSSP